MGEQCSICRHPWATEINRQLGQGVPLRTLARRFDVSKSSLARHAAAHYTGTRPTGTGGSAGAMRDKEVYPGAIAPRWRN